MRHAKHHASQHRHQGPLRAARQRGDAQGQRAADPADCRGDRHGRRATGAAAEIIHRRHQQRKQRQCQRQASPRVKESGFAGLRTSRDPSQHAKVLAALSPATTCRAQDRKLRAGGLIQDRGRRVINIKCKSPQPIPQAKPISARKRVPQRRSAHWPASPGSTISTATTVIRVTQSRASPMGEPGRSGTAT